MQLLQRTVQRFLRNLNPELTYDLEVPLLGIYAKELKAGTQTDICIPTFIAALFTWAKKWKQPKYPLTDEWINKMWPIHTIEYYSALKRNEILTRDTTWMNPEDIMLKWNKPAPKRTDIVWFHLHEAHRVVKIVETENRMVVARGWEKGIRGGVIA